MRLNASVERQRWTKRSNSRFRRAIRRRVIQIQTPTTRSHEKRQRTISRIRQAIAPAVLVLTRRDIERASRLLGHHRTHIISIMRCERVLQLPHVRWSTRTPFEPPTMTREAMPRNNPCSTTPTVSSSCRLKPSASSIPPHVQSRM